MYKLPDSSIYDYFKQKFIDLQKEGLDYSGSKYKYISIKYVDDMGYNTRHNYEGPSIIHENGDIEWWIDGFRVGICFWSDGRYKGVIVDWAFENNINIFTPNEVDINLIKIRFSGYVG